MIMVNYGVVIVVEGFEVVCFLGKKFFFLVFVEKFFCSMICLYFLVDGDFFIWDFILLLNGIKSGIINNMFFFIMVVFLYGLLGKMFVFVSFIGEYENIFDFELEKIV